MRGGMAVPEVPAGLVARAEVLRELSRDGGPLELTPTGNDLQTTDLE